MTRGLSSFDITVIVFELQELIGGYAEKIYQLTRDELLLKVQQKKRDQKQSIFIRNGELLCTTQKEFTVPEKPSVFAMTLRKYLMNGRITAITQHEFDRIIQIKIGRNDGEYTLVCELFSNGNIILLNPEGRIIRPLVRQEWAHRTIQSGEMYTPPPPQTNPFQLTKQAFRDLLQTSQKDLVRTLAITVNLSGLYAEELCVRAGINKNTKIQNLDDASIDKLYVELQHMLDIFTQKAFQPTIVKKEGTVVDILPVPFVSYQNMEFESTECFNKSLEFLIDTPKAEKQEKSTFTKKTERLQRQLASQQEMMKEFVTALQQKKINGDLIYLNFQPIDNVLKEIAHLLKQKDKDDAIKQIRLNPFVKQFDPLTDDLVMVLSDGKGDIVDVALDFRKTVSENAEQMYKENKKLQEKLNGAQKAVEQVKQALETLEVTDIVEKKKQVKQEKHWWFEKFRWFIASEGNLIIAGRDAHSNDLVVKKYLKQGDRYAHADIHGAPSCVIKCTSINDEPIPISEKTLEEACCFAASYSRAWNQFGEAQAYWVLPEQVSKTPQSGEYLPTGAFVIRGKRNYYRCPLEVAVGLVTVAGRETIMGGPATSVIARAERYVILAPGTIKKTTIAQKLAKEFGVSTEVVEQVLPPGNAIVAKAVGVEWK